MSEPTLLAVGRALEKALALGEAMRPAWRPPIRG
jgi:hypothetical protein